MPNPIFLELQKINKNTEHNNEVQKTINKLYKKNPKQNKDEISEK